MHELSLNSFSYALLLFRCTRYGVLAAGTLEGGHLGRVFVDDALHPRAGLVCTRVGYYFLAGQPDPTFLDDLYALFTGELVPHQEDEQGSPEVVLFFDPPEWQAPLFARFAPVRPLLIHKLRHVLPSGWQGVREPLPAGIRLVPYSAELLGVQPELAGEAELFFGSTAAFLEKSFGCCMMDGETVASACSAVFVGSGEVELSIHTCEAYRRRGLARLAASAFIEACLERNLHPVWGCWPENEPSVRLAQKLGFVLDCQQPVCLWVDDEGWNRK
jgi:GNAT superfamily N-acetyltransferase